ncbi:hypothetical protein AVEN_267709-1 [Araneus ventricosus]|uniref:Uncharacterized protein n=1 Tax=Araneus ventricosus TaxID=182803 RepID=A0A4Y2CWX9_ARAVE|nr:hypothetical protein AVEN_267709-1 [Araneus ventricosus]
MLNRGQMTRTTLELARPLHTSTPHQRGYVWFPMYGVACKSYIPGESSVESGFEPGTFPPRSRDLTIRLPRHFNNSEKKSKRSVPTRLSRIFT